MMDYMEREATDVLPQVLDAAGIRQCVHIGHSDGASIAALHQAATGDERVLALVLMAPHFFVEDLSIQSIRNVRTAWRETDLPQRLGKYHADAENAFCGWNEAWLDERFLEWDIKDCIDHISVPCLALQGRFDEYGTAAHIETLSARSRSDVEVHFLPECGHSPHRDQPDQTLALISAFARRVSSTQQVLVQ